jgi:peptide chain release factor 1
MPVRLPQARLDQVLDRYREVEARMGAASDGAEIVRLSKEHAELKPVADAVNALERARAQLPELEEMAASRDAEMADLARDELADLKDQLPSLEREVALLLAPKDRDENASAILEVRAGTGGDEAALFAGDLFRMYQRYAQNHGWKVEIESTSEGEVGGYKEIIASITGEGVFGRLKFESGVHRVQRVPETEAGGRIHTSAATVAVLPEPEDVNIDIRDQDLRIDTYRSSGAGGQHVNKTDSAVRITHLPTGIVVTSSEKSQHQNRARAMKVLQARLYEMQREQLDSARAESRKTQVGSGDRSERIRTYNFPQGRVTDHRINLTLYNLPKVLEGEALDDVVEPLIAEDQAARLAALEDELA